MTIITIDTETQSLNTHNWIMGCICHENMKVETFIKKRNMWNRIMELAEKHRQQKKTLLIYAHNMGYDFRVIQPERLGPEFQIFSNNPYIIDMRDENKRIYCKFLSTTSLYRGSLAEMGECIEHKKSDTPEWLKQDEYSPTWIELLEAQRYMIQDTKIVMQYLQKLKKLMHAHKLRPRWLITASQVGINNLLKEIENNDENKEWFRDIFKRKLWMTHYPEKVHEAVRGGRVQALQTGKFTRSTSIDINSHFPSCITKIRTPSLQTETYIEKPLKNGYKEKELLKNIGISNAAVTTSKRDYGVLPIRIDKTSTVYPTGDKQLIIGTWTHQELKAATERGYKILDIAWSITWEETNNPFKRPMEALATWKQEAKTDMEKHFVKMLLNGAIGKFAQRREEYDYEWANIEKEQEMIDKGYEPIDAYDTERFYAKRKGINYPGYYAPIINALTTADARLTLLEEMEKIPKKDLYYVDTDCIIAHSKSIKRGTFKYGNNLGEFKHEFIDEPLLIYGKKSYMIGNEVKLSGVGKAWIKQEDFERGSVEYKRMLTEHTTPDAKKIGTFQNLTRNLADTFTLTQQELDTLEEEKIFVDTRSTIQPYEDVIRTWMDYKDSTQA